MANRIYAVDFDGTLSLGASFPEEGKPNVPLINMLRHEQAMGAGIILYTCRRGRDLGRAVAFCQRCGLRFNAVNENLPEMIMRFGGDTRKIYADFYIDDRNMFFPTVPHATPNSPPREIE